jgi:hypothetical protein
MSLHREINLEAEICDRLKAAHTLRRLRSPDRMVRGQVDGVLPHQPNVLIAGFPEPPIRQRAWDRLPSLQPVASHSVEMRNPA